MTDQTYWFKQGVADALVVHPFRYPEPEHELLAHLAYIAGRRSVLPQRLTYETMDLEHMRGCMDAIGFDTL